MSNTKMNLKGIVEERLLNEVFRSVKKEREWKILVMDKLGSRIISTCCKMHNIMAERVTLVEDLMIQREPVPQLEAIYFIRPLKESVRMLIDDFSFNNLRYKAAHVFFTENCSDDLFNELCKSSASKYIKTLKELNISFLPIERQVFTLYSPDTFSIFYNKNHPKRSNHLEHLAEQLATLCATLGEYPAIRHRMDFSGNAEFAHLVQQKLDKYKADDPSMGEGVEKSKSMLLIVDRGFDAVSPLLHELTLQAMAYDLLDIKNHYDTHDSNEMHDVYAYLASNLQMARVKEAVLDETDELWLQLRHQHIAEVLKNVTRLYKEFAHKKIAQNSEATIKDIGVMIKKMPQYQKELNGYALHLALAEDCVAYFNKNNDKIKQFCEVEQNLATGLDCRGDPIRDSMKIMVTLLSDNDKDEDKLRLLMLFLLNKNGISEENLQKLLGHAGIPESYKSTILNMQNMGLKILLETSRHQSIRRKNVPQNRKERDDSHLFQFSRWTPVVKDLMEDAIDDKLNELEYPCLLSNRTSNKVYTGASARPTWHRGNVNQSLIRSNPRLILFVIGGVTYSEMRCAYEVTNEGNKKWDVIIGSDHIITPKQFLKDLEMKSK